MLKEKTRADAGEVFEAIRAKSTISMKNKNSVYNLLARMIKGGDIVKDGSMYSLPPDENDLPAGRSEAKTEHAEDMFGFQNSNPDQAGQ